MLALVAIVVAAALAVASAAPPPTPAAEAEPAVTPETDPGSETTEGRSPSSPLLPTTLIAGPPRIVEDLSYDEVMQVAEEPLKPSRAPALKLAVGIAMAGVLFAGAMAAAAKGFDTVFGPLFKIFK